MEEVLPIQLVKTNAFLPREDLGLCKVVYNQKDFQILRFKSVDRMRKVLEVDNIVMNGITLILNLWLFFNGKVHIWLGNFVRRSTYVLVSCWSGSLLLQLFRLSDYSVNLLEPESFPRMTIHFAPNPAKPKRVSTHVSNDDHIT